MRALVLVAFVALVACGSPKPPPAPSPVHVDRRIELVSILQRLSGAPEYRMATGTPYIADVDRELAAFEHHPAVEQTRMLRAKHGIAYDAPMILAVHLDAELRPRGNLGELLPAYDRRWRDVDVDAYVAQLRAFATDAKLDAFFAAHESYFSAVEERMRGELEREHPAGWFQALFGGTGARFIAVPGLLEGPNNYGVHFTLPGTIEMFQVIGLGVPDAQGLPIVDETMLEMLVHEMAHSFINPLVERHLADLYPPAARMFPLVKSKLARQAYTDVRTLLAESLVRAVTVLYVRDRHGELAGANATLREVRRGFVWTGELADLLDRYRKDRARYRDLDAYAPELVAFFTGLADRYVHGLPAMPFVGPIDEVVAGSVVVVAPSSTGAALTAYVADSHARFFASAPVADASEHVLAEHPGVGVIAYGTPATNPVIAEVAARAHWSLTASELRLGSKTFTGPGLALLTCWPRGDDPTHGIVVYASADDADVVGIHTVRAGGTDWVVARRGPDGTFAVLAQGDYPHAADGAWQLP